MKNNEKKTEILKVQKKAPKAPKAQKKFPLKKLPKLLKKKYTETQLQKKLLKKIYIPKDKDYIKSLFSEKQINAKKEFFCIPAGTTFTITEIKRLKKLSKDIKKQKGTIKLVPFIAIVVFLVAIGVCVTLFKNVAVKKGLQIALQRAFGAKTDIALVDVKIFDASIKIDGLEQSDQNNPMKNLFQIDHIAIDFNLTELLRGKFYSENIVADGVAVGTDRKTSGELSVKKQAKTEDKKSSDSKLNKAISSKKDELVSSATNQIDALFSEYNPQAIIDNARMSLKSPDVAKQTSEDIQLLVSKWKDTPVELYNSASDFSVSVQTLYETDWSSIKDISVLQNALSSIYDAMQNGKILKDKSENAMREIQSDSVIVKNMSDSMKKAIVADKKFVDTQLSTLKNIKEAGVKSLLQDILRSVIYQVAGEYTPYLEKGIDLIKNSSATKKDDSVKTEEKSRRLNGIDVFYKKDTVPKVLLEDTSFSGFNISANIKNLSSDQNVRNKPTEFSGDFLFGKTENSFSGLFDLRNETKNKIIIADYKGTHFPLKVELPNFALYSDSSVICNISGTRDGNFVIDGDFSLKELQMSQSSFEPQAVFSIFQNTLDNIKSMNISFVANYSSENDLTIDMTSNAINQFSKEFQVEMNSQLKNIVNKAKVDVASMLDENSGGALKKIQEFSDIQNNITKQKEFIDSLNTKLKESENKVKAQLESFAAQKGKEAVESLLHKKQGFSSNAFGF